MHNTRCEPSVNKSSSIGKEKTRAGPERTLQIKLVDVLKEWVAYSIMEKQQKQQPPVEGSSSVVDPLETCEDVLQDIFELRYTRLCPTLLV